MKKVRVAIEETVVQEFDIEIGDDDSPIDAAIAKHKAGELVLEPGEPQFRQISEISPDPSEWVEF